MTRVTPALGAGLAREPSCSERMIAPVAGAGRKKRNADCIRGRTDPRGVAEPIPMQISSKTHNACLAVLELSLRYHQPQPVCLREIAEAHRLSPQFLVQILLQLKRSGFVESVRGASGGYRLAVRPEQISLLDIVSAIDGEAQLPRCVTKNAAARTLNGVWARLSAAERQCLSATTFDELAEAVQSETAVMYYI